MDYVSPGDAFSSSLEHSLLLRADQQRQAQQDQLAAQRQAQVDRNQQEERQQAQEALAEKRQEFADKQKETRKGSFEKSLGTMVPGDIPSPDLIAQAKEFGMGHLFPEIPAEAPPPPSPAPLPIPMPATAPEGGIPLPTADPPPADLAAPPQAGGFRFAGMPKQRDQKEMETKVKAIQDRLANAEPGSAEERSAILDYEMTTNKAVPAGFAKGPAGGHTRLIFDPVKRSYTDASGTPVTDIPDGAVVDRAAEPRDTSAADARSDAHVQTTREHAYTEFNNEAKPVEEKIRQIAKFTTNLNQNNSIADSTLAEQLITLTAGGTGSGVRLSQPMITQVLGKSRTKWEDLDVALRKWNAAAPADKANTSLFFTDNQKQAMRDLARAYRQEANATLKKINDARSAIDGAKSVDEVNRLRTKAHNDIFAEPDDTSSTSSTAAPKSAADYLKDFNAKNGAKK